MFIDVTRFGADHQLRLAPAAIAYISPHTDGAVIKLIGGESLHVDETAAEIEERCNSLFVVASAELVSFDAPETVELPDSLDVQDDPAEAAAEPLAAQSKKKR